MSLNPEQQRAIDARGLVFVSAGAGTGQDEGARRALRARGLRRGPRRRLDPRDHVHGEGGRRAAQPDPRAASSSAGGQTSRASSTAPGSRRSTASATGCCARIRSRPGVDPRFRVLDESQGRVLRGEAFAAALTAFCADDDPARLRLLAVYGADGLRRMLTGVYETLRSAGPRARARAGRAPEPRRAGRRAARGRPLPRRRRGIRRRAARDGTAGARRISTPDATAPTGSSTSATCALRGERAATYEEARKRVEQAALDELAAADRDLLQELLAAFAAAYRRAKDRESALDFEDLQLRARDLLRDDEEIREREQLRFRSIMVDEFQDTNRLQCELIDLLPAAGRPRALLRRRRVPVDLRLPPRRRGGLPRAARAGRRRRAAADAELPLAAGGARRRQPPLRRGLRRRVPAARGVGRLPRPGLRRARRAARHRQVDVLRAPACTGGAARRARSRGASASSSTRARPTPGEIVLLFAAGTDAEWYEEELRALGLPTYRARAAATSASSRSSTCSRTCGCCTTATTTRRSSPCSRRRSSASRTTRSSCCGAPRRSGRCSSGSSASCPRRFPQRDAQLLRAFRQRYDRLAAALARALARAALRADRLRARLRPRRARPVGRPAPLREPAQARAARALVRGAARPRRRGLRPLRPRPGRGRRARARGGRRGGGRATRSGC